uniref:Histidine decarboxylase n=1 Tax=Talaromyces marneffei PM1 TaxID=1077442 RepID=A0A093VKG4_TALMA
MPKRTPKKDPDLYKNEEIAIKNAYDYYSQYPNQKIAKVAREFNVPYRRLLARVNGRTAFQERPAQNRTLTDDQERSVIEWIGDLDLMGIPATNRLIIGCANACLERANPHINPPPTVGIHPYNPEIVMNKFNASEILDAVPTLKIYNGEEQEIPSSPTTKSTSPPLDPYKIGRHVKKIEQDLELIKNQIKNISPNLKRRVRRMMKGSLINSHISAQHKRQVNQLLDLNRRKCKSKTRRQILNVGGVLTVRDANTKIEARKVLEIEKRWRDRERAEKARIERAKQRAQELADPTNLFAVFEPDLPPQTSAMESPYFWLDSTPNVL